jgi:hypothetical protein
MTEQPSDRVIPIFLIPFIKGKSVDKGQAYASDAAFIQNAFSSAS